MRRKPCRSVPMVSRTLGELTPTSGELTPTSIDIGSYRRFIVLPSCRCRTPEKGSSLPASMV
ncbi:MAG: hypothetical protein QM784_24330 [Polyangiaceae bacterium]